MADINPLGVARLPRAGPLRIVRTRLSPDAPRRRTEPLTLDRDHVSRFTHRTSRKIPRPARSFLLRAPRASAFRPARITRKPRRAAATSAPGRATNCSADRGFCSTCTTRSRDISSGIGCCSGSRTVAASSPRPCEGYGPLVPGEHFVMVEPENLIAACEYFLQHPAEREKIAQAGRAFVETELRQSQMCAEFLGSLTPGNDRASILALPPDRTPAPLPSPLRKTNLPANSRAHYQNHRRRFPAPDREDGTGSRGIFNPDSRIANVAHHASRSLSLAFSRAGISARPRRVSSGSA